MNNNFKINPNHEEMFLDKHKYNYLIYESLDYDSIINYLTMELAYKNDEEPTTLTERIKLQVEINLLHGMLDHAREEKQEQEGME